MPRGNPNVWKKHGASYSELAGTTTTFERTNEIAPRRLPPVGPSFAAEVKTWKAAGAPSVIPHRGAGSFVLQAGWTLGVPGTGGAWTAPGQAGGASGASGNTAGGRTLSQMSSRSADGAGAGPSSSSSAAAAAGAAAGAATAGAGPAGTSSSSAGTMPPRTYSTEARSNFPPPPSDFRRSRSAGPHASQMPIPNYPNDWCTSKQTDFRPDRYATAQPPRPTRHPDSGRLLPNDVPAGSPGGGAAHFTTQQRTHFPGRTQREAAAIPVSGCKATQAAGYNIITGAPAYSNNAFEHWDGRDYRRHR